MSKQKLVIGCPSFERAWCLPLWFDSVEAQRLDRYFDLTFCFAYTKSFDGTFDVLWNRASALGDVKVYQFNTPTFENRALNRLPMLAQVRNGLLEMVREEEPDYFLSWDDDILFPPFSIDELFQLGAKNKAIGTIVDMGGNNYTMGFPSIMNFPNGPNELAFRRPYREYDLSKPLKVDVIMAVKLMGKDVYMNSEYRWDPTGEDIGWSHSCEELGYERWIQPSVKGIHLYDRDTCLEVLRKFPEATYPDLLYPLSRWWTNKNEWKLTEDA
jgi:hypothetical protein